MLGVAIFPLEVAVFSLTDLPEWPTAGLGSLDGPAAALAGPEKSLAVGGKSLNAAAGSLAFGTISQAGDVISLPTPEMTHPGEEIRLDARRFPEAGHSKPI